MKTFRYTKITGHRYCLYNDDWEQDGVEFDYDVENDKLLPVVVNLVFEDYFESNALYCDDENIVCAIKENLKHLIEGNGLIDILADKYEETLKEIFHNEAMEFYDD